MTGAAGLELEPVRVVAAIIVQDGLVLACRRNPDRAAGGLWEFPGGKIEPGEAPRQALVREIREELGVEITVGNLLSRSSTAVDEIVIDLACYVARLVSDVPVASTDHDAMAWLQPSQLATYEWANPDRDLVRVLDRDGLLDVGT